MGALSGSFSIRRYKVVAPPEQWGEQFSKGIRAHQFVPIDPSGRDDRSVGWCSVFDPNVLDLNSDAYYSDGRLFLGLRADLIKPPAGQIKRLLRRRQAEIEAERGEPLSAGALRDLKTILLAELRQTTPPKTQAVEMVWEFDAKCVWFFSHNRRLNDDFLTLFGRTFGLQLDAMGPSSWASSFASGEPVLASRLLTLKPTSELVQGFIGLRPGPRALDDVLSDQRVDPEDEMDEEDEVG